MSPSPQKAALVTGAARGIGLAVAKRFLAEGWRMALLDIEAELLHGAIAALANPDATIALHCDVSDSGAVTAAIAKLGTRFGRFDALVNNAGIEVFAPLLWWARFTLPTLLVLHAILSISSRFRGRLSALR